MTIVLRAIGTLERYIVSDAAREDYLASYDGDRFAESMRYARSYPVPVEWFTSLFAPRNQVFIGHHERSGLVTCASMLAMLIAATAARTAVVRGAVLA